MENSFDAFDAILMGAFGGISESRTREIIREELAGITEIEYAFVNSLPLTGEKGTIYFVPASTQSGNDYYDEYMWINTKFEFLGSTRVDFSNYYTKNETDLLLNDKEASSNKITEITALSTDDKYPSAKAVYSLFTSITNGNEVTY